ncbi:MAG: hypothetical protein E7Z91_00520 [Cyanobacteria bacterium SIG30]|nr:hypothetical protein [Cyanobacteria bacterium SIG30]
MSFDINGPSSKPVIREAQSMENNGGGGNLGYMQSGKKKKEEENQETDFQFFEEESKDSFVKNDDKNEKENNKENENEKNKDKKSSLIDKFKNIIKPKEQPQEQYDFLTLSKKNQEDKNE